MRLHDKCGPTNYNGNDEKQTEYDRADRIFGIKEFLCLSGHSNRTWRRLKMTNEFSMFYDSLWVCDTNPLQEMCCLCGFSYYKV